MVCLSFQLGSQTSSVVGNKSFFDADWRPQSNLIITASADRHVRLYDPRSKEGALVKSTFTGHTAWVSCVRWSTLHEHLFISGGYDKVLRLWDIRSPRATLYDMEGHMDKILCCDWSNPEFLVSGGADDSVKMFTVGEKARGA
ncbi:unnamed protein product [Cyprideis torosa]|uniref:Uncharacterized protein n=1 Tax=Cyprideis torosa TaxID=163714 RepID=A0A7R8WEK8_9CRUS|nr:unnamed protein product [Cyprideis torosa]CAG0895862.1 unnamed protein product [Cyprideis torosa]